MLRLARVTAAHPEDHSVDLLMIDDGSRYVGAQVLAPMAGTSFGFADLPAPSDLSDRWSMSAPRDNEVMAVAAFTSGPVPVVLGFLFPQVNGVLFAEKNRRVDRHASDVYSTIDDAGNMEVYHPSGTYVRIGETAAHEDLTGKDFDGNWKVKRNTARAPHLQVVVAAAGVQKALIHIDPSGNATVELAGNLVTTVAGNATIEVDGNASVQVAGTTSVDSGGAATVTAPSVTIDAAATTVTGTLTVSGQLTANAGLTANGNLGAGIAALINGAMAVSGDVVGQGVSLKNHVHGGVQGGSSATGAPL